MEGPAFSTVAESNVYRSWGMDVIGMTNLQEAKLAREAEICYVTVAMVTDYDCWHPDHDAVTVDQIISNLMKNAENAASVVAAAVARMPDAARVPVRLGARARHPHRPEGDPRGHAQEAETVGRQIPVRARHRRAPPSEKNYLHGHKVMWPLPSSRYAAGHSGCPVTITSDLAPTSHPLRSRLGTHLWNGYQRRDEAECLGCHRPRGVAAHTERKIERYGGCLRHHANHFHAILWLTRDRPASAEARFGSSVAGSLAVLVGQFKGFVTRRVNQLRGTPGAAVWESNYFKRISVPKTS